MKNTFLVYAVLLCTAMSLQSCDKHEQIPPRSYEDIYKDKACSEIPDWGYFEGSFDGTRDEDDFSVHYVNGVLNGVPNSDFRWIGSVMLAGPYDDRDHSIVVQQTGIGLIDGGYDKNTYMRVTLAGLYKDTKYVTENYWDEEEAHKRHNSTVTLFRYYPSEDETVAYIPLKRNPFRIDITDVDWFPGSGFPATEAKMTGTLYRRDAPTRDSIVVNAVYGTR